MTDSITLSDRFRQPVTGHKIEGGVIVRRGGSTAAIPGLDELDRLMRFARDEPVRTRIQRYAVAPESPLAGEITLP